MTALFTLEQLTAIMPHGAAAGRLSSRVEAYNEAFPKYGITDLSVIACFFGQVAVESGEFRYNRELGDAEYFARYNGRLDLGNIQPGDGPRFFGRGDIQCTGRLNYTEYTKFCQARGEEVDFIANPSLVENLPYAADVACWFWRGKPSSPEVILETGRPGDLNPLGLVRDVRSITRKVNGGYNHLAERIAYTDRGLAAFGIVSAPINSAAFNFLRLGSRGDEVRKLQRVLNDRGANPPLTVDGDFGPATDAAVRAYQESKGLVKDGVVGPTTRSFLFSTA